MAEKHHKRILITGLLCSFVLFQSLFAQTLRFNNYTVDDGLPSTETYQVRAQKNGIIWIATDRGVCRFDGNTFEVFDAEDGLEDITVFAMTEDPGGRMWFATFSGSVYWFDGLRFHGHPQNESIKKLVTDNNITSLASRNDTLWLGFTYEHPLRISPSGRIDTLQLETFSKTNALWHKKVDDHQFVYGFNKQADKQHVDESPSTFCSISRAGNLYCQTFPYKATSPVFSANVNIAEIPGYGYLFSFKGQLVMVPKTGPVQHKAYSINFSSASIFTDASGLVWIGTIQAGVWVLDPQRNFEVVHKYLPDQSVSSICQDAEGGLWFSTLESGIYYAPETRHQVFQAEQVKPTRFQKLKVFQNKLIAGTFNQGIQEITSSKSNTFQIQALLPGPSVEVSDIYARDSFLVATTNLGVVEFRTDLSVQIRNAPKLILYASNDTLLGISRATISSFGIPNESQKQCFLSTRSTCVLQAEGDYWIGAVDGLYRTPIDSILSCKPQQVFGGHRITDIAHQAETVYAATLGSGTFQVQTKTGITGSITKDNGLPSDNCTAVLMDSRHQLWIATDKGLAVFRQKNVAFELLKTFTILDGLPSNDVLDLAEFEGHVWLASDKGLCAIRNDSIYPNPYLPPIQIGQKEVLSRSSAIPIVDQELNYQQNNIRIYFRGIAFRNAQKIPYRYILRGLDSLHIQSSNTFAQYNSLPPGSYRFEVQAQNNDGLWGEPASWEFRITPPFWNTWWFLALLALAAISLITVFVRYRFRIQRQRSDWKMRLLESEQRALYAQINPHFIYNALNSVQYYVSRNMGLEASDHIARFSMLMRGIFENSKSSFLSLEQELQVLRLYLEMEHSRYENKFSYAISVDEHIDLNTRIPSMVIQPLVENAIWHGLMNRKDKNGILDIHLKQDGAVLRWIIRDNGVGRTKAREMTNINLVSHKSSGMQLIIDRLDILNQYNKRSFTLEVVDLMDDAGNASGTEVTFKISEHHA